jgi:flagellar basal body-associated protein FliL
MSLLIISIPLMILAVGLAVIPLVVVSKREHRAHQAQAAAAAQASAAAEHHGAPNHRISEPAEVPVAA